MALTQVKTAGLADDAITSAKIADDAVVTAAIADDAVTGANIADDTVAEANMANDAISLTELKAGTDGQIISWDASGNPVAIGPGSDGQVLTSTGAGSPPAFEAVPAGGATINNATENELVTVASTTTQLDAEANLTFDGSHLEVKATGTTANLSITGGEGGGAFLNLNADEADDNNDKVRFGINDGGGVYFQNYADGAWETTWHSTGGGNMEIYFNNAKKFETTNTGISVTGSVTPSSGIYIGGSGGANHLDDYEEGTWTPADGGGDFTFNTAEGTYVKIGRLVILSMFLYEAGSVTSSSSAYIVGLPFTAANVDSLGGLAIGNNNSTDDFAWSIVNKNTSHAQFHKNTGANMTKAQMWDGASTPKYLYGSYVYQIA